MNNHVQFLKILDDCRRLQLKPPFAVRLWRCLACLQPNAADLQEVRELQTKDPSQCSLTVIWLCLLLSVF